MNDYENPWVKDRENPQQLSTGQRGNIWPALACPPVADLTASLRR